MESVYKILTEQEWLLLQQTGAFAGSAADHRDGFIHLATKSQIAGVIERYFKGQRPLYVARLSAGAFGESLQWETATSGEKFPHLYDRSLALDAVLDFEKIA